MPSSPLFIHFIVVTIVAVVTIHRHAHLEMQVRSQQLVNIVIIIVIIILLTLTRRSPIAYHHRRHQLWLRDAVELPEHFFLRFSRSVAFLLPHLYLVHRYCESLYNRFLYLFRCF